MAPTTFVDRLAELLGLPASVIRANAKPRGSVFVAAKRARRVRKAEKISDVKPIARYMTLKAGAVASLAEEAATSKTDENELYIQWRDASDEQKRGLEEQLYGAALKHARAVIWQQLEEQNPDLAQNIAAAVIMRLPTFRQKSKFSTWMEAIARKQIKQELRRRTRSRKVFDEYSDVFEHVGDEKELIDTRAKAAVLEMEERRVLEGLRKQLSAEDYVLLECRKEGMSMAEAAQKLGDSEDAAESRWRRLKARLKKQFRANRDGK